MPSPTAQERTAGLIGVIVALSITAALTLALHARVALSEDPAPRGPLPVAATTFVESGSYTRPSTYLGTVVAGRKSTLGFEVGGTLELAPPREGTPIASGEVIARLDQASLLARKEAAEADLAQARSELQLARIKTNRQRDLLKTGAVSQDIYDETRLGAEALSARVASATAQLKSLEVELAKTVLAAPYPGVVAERFVYDAAVLNPGSPVVRLVETAAKDVHVGIPVGVASNLVVGNRYALRLRQSTFEADLLGLSPDINPVTRATTAIFKLPDTIGALDGEPALLKLESTVEAAGGWLPIGALLEGKRGIWTVLTLTPEGDNLRARREVVEILDIQGDRAYVRGSLANGSQVVASGVHRINPGSLVTLARER